MLLFQKYQEHHLSNQADKDALYTTVVNTGLLTTNEAAIVAELNEIQGNSNNIGGYYQPTDSLADAAMRPNVTLNAILESL